VGWRQIAANPGRFSGFERAVAWLSVPTPFMGSFVMLFFIISGFCVHLPQAGLSDHFRFGPYFRRRFFRIYPPYLGAVFLTVALTVMAPGRLGLPDATPRRIVATTLMAQNYAGGPRSDWTTPEGSQLPADPALWSLPVEMELYLAYPFFLWWLRRRGATPAFGAIGLISLVAATYGLSGAGWVAGNFAMYWVIWCSGAWLAEKWARRELEPPAFWVGVVAAASLTLGMYRIDHKFNPVIGHFNFGLFYFWTVWLLLTKPALWQWLPGIASGFLRWLGGVSYSLYLLHFPMFILLGVVWVGTFGSKPANFLIPLSACVLILPIVSLFYRYIESPSHRLAKRMGRGRAGLQRIAIRQ
jgi:peptidoglycan/LPS O-acetylase OafA/YrhL